MRFLFPRLLALVLACTSIHLNAQDDDFHSLQCKGTIPEDFTKLSVEKYKEDVSGIEQDAKARVKKSKEQFYLESNYHIDALLNSGKVLFGDEVTVYVNQVADKAMAGDPALRAKLRIYMIKSPVVNAFATNNGIIFISTGLLAQLENEAQLAFVLCHEAVHFKKQHSLNEHVENDEMMAGRGKYRTMDKSDVFLTSRKYSKELETEADVEGFELLKKSEYDLNAVIGLFDVLLYADLPYDDVAFSPSYFETADYIFPQKYTYADPVAIEERMEDEDDEESTHPNVRKRKDAILTKIASQPNANGTKYAVSRDQFVRARKLCRYEVCRELLLDREYQLAFYNSYMLMKENPDSKYLQKVMLKSLYYIAKYKENGDFNEIDIHMSEIEGSFKSVAFFFDEIRANEMLVLALRYAWKIKNQYPDDEEVNLMYTDLMHEFAQEYVELSFFIKESRQQYFSVDTTSSSGDVITQTPDSSEQSEVSKIDKIKKTKKTVIANTKPEDINFNKFALVDILAVSSSFNDDYKQELDKIEEKENRVISAAEQKRMDKEERLNRTRGYALGISKVVFTNPYYERRDERYSTKTRYVVSEKIQIDFNNRIAKCAGQANVDAEILNPNTMSSDQVQEFNDHGLSMEWIGEKLDHDDESYFVSPLHNEMKDFSIRHQTPYLSYIGTINIVSKRPYPGMVLLITIVYWPTLPYGIYYVATPLNTTRYFSLLYDTHAERMEMGEAKNIKMGKSKSATMSHIYYTVMQYGSERNVK